jgi:hypothetical protein
MRASCAQGFGSHSPVVDLFPIMAVGWQPGFERVAGNTEISLASELPTILDLASGDQNEGLRLAKYAFVTATQDTRTFSG